VTGEWINSTDKLFKNYMNHYSNERKDDGVSFERLGMAYSCCNGGNASGLLQ
jgi:hypothetical protein